MQDKNIIRKIADAVEIKKSDTIIEIGPGTGALTEELLHTGAKIVAVELDERAVEVLKDKFPVSVFTNFELINANFLKFDIKGTDSSDKIKIVGNIPYYISGDILFKIFHNAQAAESSVIMMQKEVADRITAKCGCKDYGILSVAAQFVSVPKKCFDVSPNCFFPKPKVTSTVVKFDFGSTQNERINFSEFMEFVKAAFSQRRKTLRNALKSYLSQYGTYDIAVRIDDGILNRRAESLNLNEFIELFEKIGKNAN